MDTPIPSKISPEIESSIAAASEQQKQRISAKADSISASHRRETSPSLLSEIPAQGNDRLDDVCSTDSTSSQGLTDTSSNSVSGDSSKFHNRSKYDGDLIDDSVTPIKDDQYQTLPFALSIQLLSMFDKSTLRADGSSILYQWQKDISIELCAPEVPPTQLAPLKYCLVACNGSGKDSFVIAPFVVWFLLTKKKARCIVTSSSGTQLTAQTEAYIRNLCRKINEHFGCEYFRIRQRYITCRLSGSECRMFATDEEGKAEGYHPMEPGAEMAIIINEWKSVTEEITQALRRCTGYNYWIGVSSPGEPKGALYNAATDERLRYNTRRVSFYDCPNHLSEVDRAEDETTYGIQSAYYRSKHLALFTSLGGEVIIPRELVDRLLAHPPLSLAGMFDKWPLRVGGDLSAGGDEVVLSLTHGNMLFKEHFWREKDTTVTADKIDHLLRNVYKFPLDYEHLYFDDGGVGHSIIDMLVKKGWINIKRILNQSPAINKKHYGNRGAEAWDRVKRLFEESVFDPTGMSEKCITQLTSRKVKDKLVGAKVYLQSKKEAKAHGFESPDRADAYILSLTGLTIDDFLEEIKKHNNPAPRQTREQSFKLSEPDALAEFYSQNITYAHANPNSPVHTANLGHKPRIRGGYSLGDCIAD